METAAIGTMSRRGRKRKINNVTDATLGVGGKRKAMCTRSSELVGRYVQKKFKGSEVLLGRIMYYVSGLYRIKYEDGRCENVVGYKVKAILVEDGDLEGEWTKRKEALNELLLSTDANPKTATFDDTPEKGIPFDSSSFSGVTNSSTDDDVLVKVLNDSKDDVDADSSSESCESARELEAILNEKVSLIPPPELPPSSGHIGIPEEYVPHLLAVYSFLRSFSVRLFLYPFELDDFVGALNCSVANTLLDSVHVALMCFLKRQFEKFPSDDSGLASKVLRCLDWSLLDTLTWPVYLVSYLMAMGYKEEGDRKELYKHCLERDYYTLSVGKRLIILQILCDNVLDTEELRAEIDMRETSEAGTDADTLCEPARVDPGYSKSSDYKDIEVTQTVEKHQTTHSLNNQSIESQVSRAGEDGYGDECRLCGMDGVLVCCDGCPSAYHSRCLGLNKMPSGSWHCPECKVDASNPRFLHKTTLRGADVLGVDPYNQVFVATCDHLLVLKTSLNRESCSRYYNRHDIPGVLNALNAKAEHAIVYSDIGKGLMQYWEFPSDIPSNNKSGIGLKLATQEGSSLRMAQLNNLPYEVPNMSEVENNGTCASCTSEIAGSLLQNSLQPPVLGDNIFDTKIIIDDRADSMKQECGILKTMITGTPTSSSLIGQPANPCASSQQRNLNLTDAVSRRCGDVRAVNDTLEAKGSFSGQELSRVGNACGSSSSRCLYMGSSFSRTGYINLYLHGDFSATAAANLAILSHEENQVSECLSSDNHQKIMCVIMPLQIKAFASAAVHFFWPNVEEKLADVPRERCSWCFSCKAPTASKRGCLLNAAASNATRGAMKVLSGVRPVKNGMDDRLSSIGTYIMVMEERLSGLLVGPFLNDTFRKQWRRQLEQATTCTEIKTLLLELEVNMRSIAFSGDWTKLVEDLFTQSSTSQIATGSTQKCRPGRRGKKQHNMAEVVAGGLQKKFTDFTWWRGGMVSKLMFRRGILPSSLIRNSARQGGKKKLAGVRYVEGNEIPRISRQLIWRSAVELSRTVAHLALQVRYLDLHVRWDDLGRPELIRSDGKSSEAEASAFRNAFVCGKKTVNQEVRYCVAFGSRKHLPSRVMKNITEIDQILENGKERYWFSETFIPLYLIREYEQKVEKNKSVNALSKLQRRQLKASRENIFSSLLWKQGNTAKNCCSCHQDIFYRNAAKCNACQGFCHQKCATTSTVQMREEIDLVVICKLCCQTQVATPHHNISRSPTNPLLLPTKPLLLQGQDVPNPVSTKDGHLVSSKGSSASFGALECLSEVKSINGSASTKKITKSNWGLIWRKKNSEDTGFDFRLKNILMKSNTDKGLIKPLCRLCDQPYNPDLMYIRCATCNHWFHADSVELDESKVFSVVGYKCCKCRRIKSPVCPYAHTNNVMKDKIEHQKAKKPKIPAVSFNRDMILNHHHHKGVPTASELPRKAEVIHISAANNPLLASPDETKQFTEGKSEGNRGSEIANASPGPRKLPVRRHASQFEESFPFESNAIISTQDICLNRSRGKANYLSNYSFRDEVTNSTEVDAVISMQEYLLQQLSSDGCFDLETNVGGDVNGKEPPESVTEDQKMLSPVPAGNVAPKVCQDGEKLIKSPKQSFPCKFCSEREVGADVCCEICGVWIHKSCSPWYESLSDEDGWRCGNCRDWC